MEGAKVSIIIMLVIILYAIINKIYVHIFLTGCSAGTYSSSGNCETCPANTITTEVATGQCECVRGYFRNTIKSDTTCNRLLSTANENAATGCTGKHKQ